MWQRRWSLGKYLYLFLRYLGVSTIVFDVYVQSSVNLTSKFCNVTVWLKLLLVAAAVISAQVVLICRVYAVYERNKKLLIVLAILYALEILASLLVLGLHTPVESASPSGLSGCRVDAASSKFGFGLLPSLIHEIILCSLMILKAIQNYRDGCGSPLVSEMIYDSMIYFVGIFAALFVDFTFYFLKKQDEAGFALAWESTIPCTMGCRLLVNTIEGPEVSTPSHDTMVTSMSFSRIDRLPVHQSGVQQITAVAPAMDDS